MISHSNHLSWQIMVIHYHMPNQPLLYRDHPCFFVLSSPEADRKEDKHGIDLQAAQQHQAAEQYLAKA